MVFQTITMHWVKAGRFKVKKNYRMGDARAWMEYLQTFPRWWASSLDGVKRAEAISDAIPPLYVYYLFMNKFRYKPRTILDLYAGIGGWLLGIALYMDNDFYYEAVEKNRDRCRALERSLAFLNKFHYITIDYNIHCTDVMDYEANSRFDLVVGSPPCEDVTSLSKLSRSRFDVREVGTYRLTEKYIEFVEKVKPHLAIYENVPDQRLEEVLKDAGFTVEVHDMSAIIPQHRKRIIAYKYPVIERWGW